MGDVFCHKLLVSWEYTFCPGGRATRCAEHEEDYPMPQPNNSMEVFKLLQKTNCRRCSEPTCLAFAVAVFQGKKQLDECPQLDVDVIERFGGRNKKPTIPEPDQEESMAELKRRITEIDLAKAAQRLGADFCDEALTIKVLGKDFRVDSQGNLSSAIHIHAWVAIPVSQLHPYPRGTRCIGKVVVIQGTRGWKEVVSTLWAAMRNTSQETSGCTYGSFRGHAPDLPGKTRGG